MKKLTFILLFVLLGGMAFAQENGNRDSENRIVRGPYETNRFFDNIFFGVAGGANVYFGENDSYGSFGKRLAPAVDINIGKWFTPSVGARIGYSGVHAKGWTPNGPYKTGTPDENGMYSEKFGVSYLHGDLLWNFSNTVSGYKETRTWNFVPFIGAGWARSYKDVMWSDRKDKIYKDEIGVSVGLLNNIRLCSAIDLTLEVRGLIVNQRFDGVVGGKKGEGMLSTTLGLTYKFNKRNFNRVQQVEAVDLTSYMDRIASLENSEDALAAKNNALNTEIEALRNKPAEVKVITETADSEISVAPVALFFHIGSAKLDTKELTNLEFFVRNAMRVDKNRTFTLIGSADNATGTAEINQRLSEERMNFVYRLLVDKYGIDSSRLTKKAEGDTNNRFAEPALNRVVIIE